MVSEKTLSFPPLPSLSNLDLRLLRIFQAIVRCGGFSAAQYELNMSQSAISSQMKQLEDRLGVRLCERGRSGFKLTEGGEVVYRSMQDLFQAAETFQNDIEAHKGQLSGQLYVALDDATATNPKSPLGRALQDLVDQAPDVEIHLSVAPPAELEAGLLEDRYHLAIAPFHKVSDSLHCYPIYTERETLYCGETHPLFEVAHRPLAELDLTGMRYVARSFMDGAGRLENLSLHQCARASNMEALVALLLTGEYIGYVARHFAELWVNSGQLKAIADEELTYRSQHSVALGKSQEQRPALFFLHCLTKNTKSHDKVVMDYQIPVLPLAP